MTSVMQAIRAMERCDVVVVLVDVLEGLADQDLRLVNLADRARPGGGRGAQQGRRRRRRGRAQGRRRGARQAQLRPVDPRGEALGQGGTRHDRAAAMVDRAYEAHGKRVGTGEVNRFFEEVLDRHPPPTHLGKAVRVYYITQVGTHPPRFAAMTNHPEAVATSYQRYVQNQLRERFAFDAVPVRVSWRARRRRGDAPPGEDA
jgi:GTP-binding protein